MDEESDELELQDRLRAVEYEIWRKNAPFLYDLEIVHTLVWPSLTVEWLPGKQQEEDANYSIQQCILGTHTSGAAQNYLMLADVGIPNVELGESEGGGSPAVKHTFEHLEPKIAVPAMVIPHEGEVNKARYMPQQAQRRSFLIATKTVSAQVYVFDTANYEHQVHGHKPSGEEECRPDLRLTGHKAEGYGLSWSHLREGYLLSGSDDTLVCTWDINATPRDGWTVKELQVYEGHENVVEDVCWHHFNPHVFGSVGDDKQLILWDTRKPPKQGALKAVEAHSKEVNGIDFNPHNPHLLATCSSDTTVALRDWRCLNQPLHVLEAHTDGVYQLSWSPQHPTVLASSALDRRLLVWDISKIGAQQTPEDAEDGPPEQLFVHAGQSTKLNDIAWNGNDDWVMATVSEDNNLQVWQMTESIRNRVGAQQGA